MIVIHYKCALIKLPISGCEINDRNLGECMIKFRVVKFFGYYEKVDGGQERGMCRSILTRDIQPLYGESRKNRRR